MLIMADPTISLVHGAFADASGWSRLYAELAGDGLTIKAPPNPLRGVTVEDGEYMKCVTEGASHAVMLSRPAVVADVVREAVRSCAPGGLHS